MTKSIHYLIAIFFLMLSDLSGAERYDIIPLPKQIEKGSGSFPLNPNETTIQINIADSGKLDICAEQLNTVYRNSLGAETVHGRQAVYEIILGIPAEDRHFAQICRNNACLPQEKLGREGYVLLIAEKRVIIAAHAPAGLFYGAQTLKQLIRAYAQKNSIPALKITDWPDFAFRGIHDDISRGPVPSREYMKEQIRRLSALKINALSYYTEHVLVTKSHPDFAPAGGAISINEWEELDQYAQKHFIQLIPNFQSFAHFEKILAFPQYKHLGDTERLLSPVSPQSTKFLNDIYRELAPAFQAPYFMAGCDETWDLGRGKSKKSVDSLGYAYVYANHINRLVAQLKRLNKRTIIWADEVLKHPKILDLLYPKTVLATWHYGALKSFTHLIEPLKSAGFDVLVCPGILNSRRIMPDYSVTLPNIRRFVKDGYKENVMGVVLTVWDDGGEALFSLDWYGLAFSAEQSWYVNDLPEKHYDRRFNRVIYGDSQQKISRSIAALGRLTHIIPTQKMNLAVFWRNLIPEEGKTAFLNRSDWQEVKNIADSAQSILSQAKPSRFIDDLKAWQFTVNRYQYLARSRLILLDAASFYREACLLQRKDREQAAAYLQKTAEALEKIQLNLTRLTQAVKKTWLMENRRYWLDRVMEKYDKQKTELIWAERRLQKAADDFKTGFYLPAPNEIGLAIERVSGHYFLNWLLCGPFPNIKSSGRSVDYLKNIGGELKARPRSGLVLKAPNGEKMVWREYSSPDNAAIDLMPVYEKNTEVVAYAYCVIESPDDRKVRATFGSNNGIQVFLNGKKLFDRNIKRSLLIDEEEAVLPLQKGKNHLLLKIDQHKGGWGFSFRLPDEEVRSQKYTYRILNKD